MKFTILALFVAVVMVGCGGDSGGDPVDIPPVDVSGSWQTEFTNAGSAYYRNCTGDATVFNDNIIGVQSGDGSQGGCHWTGQGGISQTGSSFTFLPNSMSCDNPDENVDASGGGTITGESFVGQSQFYFPAFGVYRKQLFRGGLDGHMIHFQYYRMTFSGNFNGACDIVPALHEEGMRAKSGGGFALPLNTDLTSTLR